MFVVAHWQAHLIMHIGVAHLGRTTALHVMAPHTLM
jgi:hypothetical protein